MSTTSREQDMDQGLVARLVQQIDDGAFLPMPLCIDNEPFGRTDRHIFEAAAAAGCDASFSLVLKGPLTAEQVSALEEKESSRWENLQAFAYGPTPREEEK